MKANEASEKIYMSPAGVLYKGDKQQSDDIEYARTDAFIKKAEEFIYSALNDGIMGTPNIKDFMRLFKEYMKGE